MEHTRCSCPCKRDDTALHIDAPRTKQPGYETAGLENAEQTSLDSFQPPTRIVPLSKSALSTGRKVGRPSSPTRRVDCSLTDSQQLSSMRKQFTDDPEQAPNPTTYKGESSDSNGSAAKTAGSSSSTATPLTPTLRYAADTMLSKIGPPPSIARIPTSTTTVSEKTEGYFENETDEEPPPFLRPRRGGECALTIDKRVVKPPRYPKDNETRAKLRSAFEAFCILSALTPQELEAVVDAVSIVTFDAEAQILQQGDMGDAMYVVLAGVVDCYAEASNHQSSGRLTHITGSTVSPTKNKTWVTSRETGAIFGELSIISNKPRSLSVFARGSCTLGRLDVEVYQCLVVQRQVQNMENRAKRLRGVTLLEMLTDEQIMQLADVLKVASYEPGEAIIRQDDSGEEFFIVQSGECVATVRTGSDIQEVQRFFAGDLFGELSLLKNAPRAATITAVTQVDVLYLSRRRFERMLGPLSLLRERNYLNDPRKIIADYYQPGDSRGPYGAILHSHMAVTATKSLDTTPTPRKQSMTLQNKDAISSWFAVFRPTSKDAIAKMLSGTAVGKGLNIKGKSAKKNRLSGFVPFVQISDNNHKPAVERPPADAVIHIFYKTKPAREEAFNLLMSLLQEERAFTSNGSALGDQSDASLVYRNERYAPNVYGLDVPAVLVCEAYLMRPDLTPWVDWETGRPSEPAFMNMNLQAAYGGTLPEVVLYQYDEANPMNPRGLLVAYAEAAVKPVVSDFDAFLVGSSGFIYETLPREQVEMMSWTLDKAEDILENPGESTWTERWLETIEGSKKDGFHPIVPKYGYGDPSSTKLISRVIAHTAPCGAVRHGAECFNFYFPQEADNEYLIIWDGFQGMPWEYKSEKELQSFLLERVKEGFSFPLNPVWPIRDPSWYEILDALRTSESAKGNLTAWYPPEYDVLDRIDRIHEAYPDGFQVVKAPEPLVKLPAVTDSHRLTMQNTKGSSSDQFPNQVQVRVSRVLHHKVQEYWRRRSELGLDEDSDDDSDRGLNAHANAESRAPKARHRFPWGRRMIQHCLGAKGLFKPRQEHERH